MADNLVLVSLAKKIHNNLSAHCNSSALRKKDLFSGPQRGMHIPLDGENLIQWIPATCNKFPIPPQPITSYKPNKVCANVCSTQSFRLITFNAKETS